MPSNLKPEFFRRLDDSDDELFYLTPRFVVHIDDAAISNGRRDLFEPSPARRRDPRPHE